MNSFDEYHHSLFHPHVSSSSFNKTFFAFFFLFCRLTVSIYSISFFMYFPFALSLHYTSSRSSSMFPSFLCNSSPVCRLFHVVFLPFLLIHHRPLTSSRSHFLYLGKRQWQQQQHQEHRQKKRNRSRTLIRYFIRTNFYICECRAKRWTRIAHPQSTFPNSTADKLLLFVALFSYPLLTVCFASMGELCFGNVT